MTKPIGDVVKVGTNLMELIQFVIYKKDKFGNEKKCNYGINVFKVREVIKTPKIVPLPEKIEYIDGMFNLRDENIPLLNLVERLGGEEREYSRNIVIVAEFNNIFIGLLVHEVVQIHRISWQKILPSPKITSSPESDLIIGVVKLENDESLVILDFERIVNEINPVTDVEVGNVSVEEKKKEVHRKHTVLLADDSKIVRKQMNELLTKLGFNVMLAENGAEALKMLNNLKTQAEEQDVSINSIVSIVITDIEMPQMDGYTLTNKIKTDNVLQKLPVIMHTSLSGDNVKLRGKEVGADEYITKFSVEHIKATLDKVIKQFYPN